jgi:acyl-CoA synthetase (AMP-forming)/AMP-acid ligase II
MAAFAGAMLLGAVPAILAYPNFKVDPQKYASGLVGVSRNLNARVVLVDQAFPANLKDGIMAVQNAAVSSFRPSGLEASPVPTVSCEPHHVAFIQHSAGTTGLQKGVALSHSAVCGSRRPCP